MRARMRRAFGTIRAHAAHEAAMLLWSSHMRITVSALTLLLATASASAAATTLPGPAFPTFERPAQIAAACERSLKGARQRVAALERMAPGVRWMTAADDLSAHIEDTYYPISFVGNVHPDKALRDAAEACDLRWQDFSSSLGQNEKLYQVARRLKPRDAIDREFIRVTLESFEDAGVSLPKDKRARAKAISDRITELNITFDKNIRDDKTRVAFTEAELAGVPESSWKSAPRDGEGRVQLGIDDPSYVPVLTYADSAVTRERMWRAKQALGGPVNIDLLDQIVKLRLEYAQLFGYPSYADFVLRRRMARDTKTTSAFLDELKGVVEASEKREVAELRDAKAQHLGQPAAQMQRWDIAYYTERVKRARYSVDQNAFRPYFPPQESLHFVMRIAEKLFGVRYERVPAKLWHPEAQAYAVHDVRSGKPIATLLVDLYPRDGKYNHAAVWSYRGVASRTGRTPQAALVVNFDRTGLTLEELETLLHEFGHAVHNNLSTTRYIAHAGTSTLNDFSEAPSQMLEDWVYDPRVLALMREVCASCKPVPDELLAQAVRAREFGRAIRYSRQHLYASYDLALHTADAPNPLATWARMEGATPVGHVPGSLFPASFSHVAGGYAAGYYGYLWSEVVAHDLRTPFAADKMNAAVGRRYRDTILANGGQRPPGELVRDFLGRETNSKAFFDYVGKR
jgi:thimet oligopeptidase